MDRRNAIAQRDDRAANTSRRRELAAVSSTRSELVALDTMTVGELVGRYHALFGVSTRTRNKVYLRKRIAWRIQELAEGGLSPRALARIEELAPQAPARWRERIATPGAARVLAGEREKVQRDPRLPPPGTVITRIHDGVEHKVTVLAEGFEYNGERHRSLSKIARLIAGTSWNGFAFFFGRTAGARGGGARSDG